MDFLPAIHVNVANVFNRENAKQRKREKCDE